jgi:tRNA threonylcarbamoyl adenosine modification protein YeaZ
MLHDIFSLSLRSIYAMKAPIGLAIHTSSPDLGLAIGGLDDIRQEVWDLGRDMTTYLHEKLAQFIQPQSFQDLAFIAVAQGPGSFTGTRMGMTVARTLAQQLSIPLFGISSLGAIAATQATGRMACRDLQRPV